MVYNLDYKKRFQYKSLFDRFLDKINKGKISNFENKNYVYSFINICHVRSISPDNEYYIINIISNVDKSIIFEYKNQPLDTNIIKASSLKDYIILYTIDFKISNKEKTIECETFCRYFFEAFFHDSKNSHSKIIDSKDLDYIKQINSLLFDNKDDIINYLFQKIII